MSGFPLRPSRAAFGPTYVNKRPIRRPDQEVGDTVVNLSCWQLAGLGIVCPLVWANFDAAGALLSSGEAFDPNGVYVPSMVHVGGTNLYTITYLATYPDENGTEQALALTNAKVAVGGTTNLNGVWRITSSRIIEVRLFVADSGASTEAPFYVEAR
jgi:hypothetical protein